MKYSAALFFEECDKKLVFILYKFVSYHSDCKLCFVHFLSMNIIVNLWLIFYENIIYISEIVY